MTKWYMLGLVGLLGLGACVGSETQIVDRSELNAVPADYRTRITAWAQDFFADPHGLRAVRLSDPVPARDGTGTQLWLICLEADARAANGGYLGVQRFAFGYTKQGVFSAPLRRTGSRVSARDCDRFPLVWTPWPALERL